MRSTHGSAFVFLHGLGDQGSSWRHLEGKVAGVSKWLFPNAPNVPVTVNGGARCPSWFDMDEIPVVATSSDKVADVKASVVKVHAMLKGLEAEGFASESIYVGGFSQGGAIALLACLTYPRKLGGAAVLSGWLMLRDELLAADSGLASPANASGLRVFWGHGEADGVVPLAEGRRVAVPRPVQAQVREQRGGEVPYLGVGGGARLDHQRHAQDGRRRVV